MQMRPVETLGEISNILRLMEQPPRRKGRGTQMDHVGRGSVRAAGWGQRGARGALLELSPGLCMPSVVPEPRRLGGTPLLLHTNMFSSCSGSFLPLNRTHFPASFVVLQIMGYKELMAEYKSI